MYVPGKCLNTHDLGSITKHTLESDVTEISLNR